MTEILNAIELARLARRTLAEADEVTLMIHGVGRVGADPDGIELVMRDVDGSPTFLCPPDSLLTRCLGIPAMLSVPTHDPDAGGTLVLVGRLELDAGAATGSQVVVELRTTRIVLERDQRAGWPVAQHEIPLDLYAGAVSEEFVRYTESIVEHTNACHHSQLRDYAALRTGRSADDIADARLTRLDGTGADVAWIDVEGAHSLTIGFDPPVRSPTALAIQLRDELERA